MASDNDSNPYATPKSTPAEIQLQRDRWSADYVGFWLRVVAFFVDVFLIIVTYGVTAISLFGRERFMVEDGGKVTVDVPLWVAGIYCLVFWLWKSATPGKLLIAARIVDVETLDTPKVWQYIVRVLGYPASFLPLGLGFIWIAFNDRKRAWHDYLARTVVIRE